MTAKKRGDAVWFILRALRERYGEDTGALLHWPQDMIEDAEVRESRSRVAIVNACVAAVMKDHEEIEEARRVFEG